MNLPVQASEIADAARRVLEDVAPRLQGRDAFDARVAERLLALLQRELVQSPHARQQELAGLQALLPGCGGDVSLEMLRSRLCEAIASGELGREDDALVAHLWRTTLAQLAIDSPRYRWCDAAEGRV